MRAKKSEGITISLLLLIVLGLCAAGKSKALWPIAAYTMYSARTTPYPAPSASMVDLRVISRSGLAYTIGYTEPFPMGYDEAFAAVIENVFRGGRPKTCNPDCVYLIKVVRHYLAGVPISRVEGWKYRWTVDALALPPLLRERPSEKVFLGAFQVSPNGESITVQPEVSFQP
jgi:hypothetical protein